MKFPMRLTQRHWRFLRTSNGATGSRNNREQTINLGYWQLHHFLIHQVPEVLIQLKISESMTKPFSAVEIRFRIPVSHLVQMHCTILICRILCAATKMYCSVY